MINFTVLKSQAMKGRHYVTNAENEIIAVQIDLKKYGQLWEDFYDTIIVEDRKDEESIPWEDIKQELRKDGK
jgi:hypothetical protein